MKGHPIQTFYGRAFDIFDPHPEDVCIEDIAHALSLICRFSGRCRVFYSVAEHSVRVSRLLQQHGHPIETLRWGLLHDAAEAYVGDISRPIKRALGALFVDAEEGVMTAIAAALDLPGEMPTAVAWADDVLLATERAYLLGPPLPDIWIPLPEPLVLDEGDTLGWSPEAARERFLARWQELSYWRDLGRDGLL